MTNHLNNATSPYLLQHASNPVDWHPWEAATLQKAINEDKPIFLSIGYAACHWCHVMAHESFEDHETASLMNTYFINIKVDREERPDLDSIYMAAIVALTGQGGWPMSLFLTPDLKPFFGGTYFPPQPSYGRPAFREVLQTIVDAWFNKRQQILNSSQQIATYLQQQVEVSTRSNDFSPTLLLEATQKILDTYDWLYGGWGSAPKFPQAMLVEFLLRRYHSGNEQALNAAQHALEAMSRGGMYDVVGGGFSRYSTDNHWHIPHFEKMLYDNALLVRVYLHAWQITRLPDYRRVVEETLDFIEREMLDELGGFYSSLDADSEGEEGKYYWWTLGEIQELLGEKWKFLELAYDLRETGNWKGKTIFQRTKDNNALAVELSMSNEQIIDVLNECHLKLLQERNRRIRPATDDKVLANWNGLMLRTMAEASRVLESKKYYDIACRNAEFILSYLRVENGLRHSWRAGRVGVEVFLEDYASLILGLLELYQTDFNLHWFEEAKILAEQMIQRFRDSQGVFYDTAADAQDLLIRPKNTQDNVTPSGNALAVEALLWLAALDGKHTWTEIAKQAIQTISQEAANYPSAFAYWLCVADSYLFNQKQVAIIGELSNATTQMYLKVISKQYHPDLVWAVASFPPTASSPLLLKHRPMKDGKPTVYFCDNFVCLSPISNPDEFLEFMKSK